MLSCNHARFLPNFDFIRDLMVLFITCKNKRDPFKNEGVRVVTTLFICFSDAQGQLTLQSKSGSGRNSKSFKLFRYSALPARMKKIFN